MKLTAELDVESAVGVVIFTVTVTVFPGAQRWRVVPRVHAQQTAAGGQAGRYARTRTRHAARETRTVPRRRAGAVG